MVPRDHAAPAVTMESYFRDVAAALDGLVQAGETYTAWFSAEASDFVRMSRGKVRQPGSVVQRYVGVDLIRGARHATQLLSLAGDLAADRRSIASAVAAARAALADAGDDPHLLIATDVRSSRETRGAPLPPAEVIVDAALEAARGTDLVGLYAGGPMYRGFANSHGQRNWHEAHAFNFQWSLYHRADKAVKSALSGFAWDPAQFAAKMDEARVELGYMTRPAKALAPGKYRTFLTPAAMEDVASMMCWGGFSARALATKQSSFTRMQGGGDGAQRLDPRVTIAEATSDGVAPAFQAEGFVRPARVPLIEGGRLVGSLVSPRTAREFGLAANGANGDEGPEALEMAPGTLAARDALGALGTGLYVGNLHYLNYSDRPAARITGMTRFATFWVEGGKIVAPVDVLRFDDTLFRMLGANLDALTAETELLLASDSYRERQLASMRLPGALLSEMTFTL
ncbi:MAG TPA: metallopeptidase TldD-related protein [Casimicrobiaceae bacterium]|nr:metallopeptidase TldD-related protein [Casimicrobiaceae bacterium]